PRSPRPGKPQPGFGFSSWIPPSCFLQSHLLREDSRRADGGRMSGWVLTVNGASRSVEAPPEESLLSVLRNRLGLTGTKYGCGEGQCGACTVLLDGRPARSCRTQVSEAAGRKVTTIEGLARNGRLHAVQAAFLEVEAFE